MRRLLAALFVLTILTAGLGMAQAQDTVTIEYWNINNEGFGGPTVDSLIASFETANPGIQVGCC